MKMIIKDKNKSKIKTKSKILVLGLILLVLAGLFSPVGRVQAQATITATGCYNANNQIQGNPPIDTKARCDALGPSVRWVEVTGAPTAGQQSAYNNCVAETKKQIAAGGPPYQTTAEKYCAPVLTAAPGTTAPGGAGAKEKSTLYDNLNSCGVIIKGTLGGCLVTLFYFIFYGLTSFLLSIAARLFDVVLALALSSSLYGSFISDAWEVVRDLSNLFFILILLYIGIKIILGLGGSEVKKMIAQVVIMALLINFSMFMTKVVIDTSNILALIFYNKISVVVVRNGKTENIDYISALSPTKTVRDKDIAGALVGRFDPSKLLSQDFFDKIKKTTYQFSALGFAGYVGTGALLGSWIPVVGTVAGGVIGAVGYVLSSGETAVPIPLMLGIITVTGLTMAFAAYAFFIAGLAFLSRLLELWILIIASPFAFMSSTVPILSGIPHVGWKEWLKRLLQVSFMAPIFMFFMYLIIKIIQADPIGSLADRTPAQQGWMEAMLFLIIPALIILILLLKATAFAQKWSGHLGETMIKGATMAAGLTGGLALGGAALALRTGIGGGGGFVANKLASGANILATKKFLGVPLSALGANKLASGLTSVGKFAQKSSFDVRGVKIGGQTLASATGMSLGEAQKGGIEQRRKEKVEKRMKRADELKVREDEGLKQKVNKAEMDLQVLLNKVAKDFEIIDRDLVDARQRKADAQSGSAAEATAIAEINSLKAQRNAIKDGSTGLTVVGGPNAGKSIKDMEKTVIPDAKNAVLTESRRRTVAFANRTANWRHWGTANKEARHKIIMESKIESKGEK